MTVAPPPAGDGDTPRAGRGRTGAPAVSARPYHVQTAAERLGDGFPWFAHHESVSRLWSEKWHKPCAAGIYPFTDADVEP